MKKKVLTVDDAEKLFSQTKKSINSFAAAADGVREKIFDLINYEVFNHLNYSTEQAMFKELFKGCNKHRSTLNDYKICAIVEIELNIDQGKMSTDALVALHQGTRKGDWIAIYELASEECDDGKFPTKSKIVEAKQKLNPMQDSNSDWESIESDEGDQEEMDARDQLDEMLAAEAEEVDDFGDDSNSNTEDEIDDGETPEIDKLTFTLERVKRYPVIKKKRILAIINPVTKPGQDTLYLLRKLSDDQFEEFKDSIIQACSKK